MKTQKIIYIVSLTFLLLLFPVNLMSQVLFTAKDELVVYKNANVKSDSIYTLHISDKVEVVEIKKVWFKKWAKIQSAEGKQGYVFFNKLEPIDVNKENKEEDTTKKEFSTQNNAVNELQAETQNVEKQDSYDESANVSKENSEKNLDSDNILTDDVSHTNEHSKKSFPAWVWFVVIVIVLLIWKVLTGNKSSTSTISQNYNPPPKAVAPKINIDKTQTFTLSTWNKCSTCEFWAGSRRPSHFRDKSEHESDATGECAGAGWNRHQTFANFSCSSWKLWGILKNN